jgi:hypothetical protein
MTAQRDVPLMGLSIPFLSKNRAKIRDLSLRGTFYSENRLNQKLRLKVKPSPTLFCDCGIFTGMTDGEML